MIYPQGSILYIVRAGDTPEQLILRFTLTADDLIRVNPCVNVYHLEPGQVIRLPVEDQFPDIPTYCPYIVKVGDTFYGIARSHGVTLNDLLDANPGLNPDRLMIGQPMCIPPEKASPPSGPAGIDSPSDPIPHASSESSVQTCSPTNSTAQANATAALNPNLYVNLHLNPPSDPGTGSREKTAPATPAGQETGTLMSYLVKPGETPQLIAKKFHTTVAALHRANPGVWLECVLPGQKIFIGNHWSQYTNPRCKIRFLHPSTWQRISEERYEGSDGFFHVTLAAGENASLENICWGEAYGRTRPYGSQPSVQREFIQGHDARIILPSDDQPVSMNEQAALILRTPSRIELAGQIYHYLLILVSKSFVHEIAQTMEFLHDPA